MSERGSDWGLSAAPEFRPIVEDETVPVIDLWTRCDLVVPWNDPARDIAFARSSPNAEVLARFEDGRVTAAGMVGHDGHRGWLYYIAVDLDFQGRGLGKALVRACEAWLAERGCPKAMLMIREGNTKVQTFYESADWSVEPRAVMSRWLKDGTPMGLAEIETTVTSLEMTERPTRVASPAPSGQKLSLIRAVEPTVDFYRWLYDAVGRDWTWMERRLLSDADLGAVITDPKVEIYVLYRDGVPAGYGEIDRRSGPDAVELGYFGLMPHAVGLGIGRYFIDAIIDLAWMGETRRLWVHTCDLDHPRAIGIYQKAGFRPFDQYVQTLPDPRLVGLTLPPSREDRGHRVVSLPQDRTDATVTPLRR